eukprot:2166285-Amphidinium_carterae.1
MTGNNTNKRLNARFVAKGCTQRVNPDELYAATPAAVTLRILLCLANIKKYQIYLSNSASAFPNIR